MEKYATIKALQNLLQLAYINILHYLSRNRDKYPPLVVRSLFRACTLALAFMIAAIGLNVISRMGGAIAEDIIMQAGMAIVFCIFCLFCGILLRAFLLAVPHAVSRPSGVKVQRLIAAEAEWTPPDIAPDNLLCLMPCEEMAAFATRFRTAQGTRSYAIWSVCIPPFQAECVILTADESTDFFFSRGTEPFAESLKEEEKLPTGLDHLRENRAQYQRYVDWFCAHYARWATAAKLEANQGRAHKTMLEIMDNKARTVVLMLLLIFAFSPGVFAQSKTKQVDETLGTRIREIPKSGDKVVFVFNEKNKEVYYNRVGDGKSEYTELLKQAPGIGGYNDEGGALLWIEKNGEVICRAEQVQSVNQTPVGPNGEVYLTENNGTDEVRPRGQLDPPPDGTPQTDQPLSFAIPDSMTLATQMEGWKESIRENRSKVWASVAPVWDFLMWCFGGLLIFLICVWGIFNYVAASAANESLVTIYGRVIAGRWIVAAQQNAAALCLVVCWIIVITLLINEFLWLVWLNIPIWTLLLLWFPSLWIAKRLTDWAVPNLKVAGHSNERGLTPY